MDDDIKALLKSAGLGPDAVWQHKQSKQWIVYHWALEECAAKRGVTLDPPVIVTADPTNKIAVICVTGRLGEHAEWSFGEAAPYNTTQTYPFAMAEKRAKDRVILKLLNLHGRLYSEVEADDFNKRAETRDATGPKGNPPGITKFREETRKFHSDMRSCATVEEFDLFIATSKAFIQRAANDFPADYNGDGGDVRGLVGEIDAYRNRLAMAEAEPAMIPVPDMPAQKDRWAAWCPILVTTIQDCSVDRIDGWIAANESPLSRLKIEFPAWHDKLMEKVELARTSPLSA